MVKGLYETVRVQLLRDVLLLSLDDRGEVRRGSTTLPALDLDQLVDQPANMTCGWSFLKHPDNQLDGWDTWLFNRLADEPALGQRFVRGIDYTQQPPKTVWREDAVAQYMKAVRRFKEGLFALVHLSAGAPARGTEITSVTRENPMNGAGHRGVFVEGGLVSFVTTYHKGYSFTKRVKTIHRYVPREVSELVVYFLGLGQPFIDDVQMMCYNVDRVTAFIWEPPTEASWDGSDSESSDPGDGDEEDEDRGTRPRDTPINPDGYWGTDRRRRVLREQTLRHGNIALGTQTWRHAYPAIHRELIREGSARQWLDTLYYGQEPEMNDARALQSGHNRATEEANYGRSCLESPWQTTLERQAFRRVSQDWHRILEFASAWEDAGLRPGARAEMMAQRQQQALARWSLLATADYKAEFCRLVGRPDARYRGVQKAALDAVLQRKLRIVAVMATGSGKSLLFMLPASLSPSGITVVIAPYKALRDDLQVRCTEQGISCAIWDGQRPPYWASIVLITPESAVTKSFGRFLDEQRMLRQLDRIVIDECHVLLESSQSWRPDLLRLMEMTEKGTQVLYLTATLPPTLQPAFFQCAGLDAATVTLCRDPSTARRNIAYRVLDYPRGPVDQTLVQLVADKRKQYGPDAQIIVFCPTVKETKRLAKVLACTAYHRDMDTEEARKRMVRRFTSGAEKLCTATTMLGLGIDAEGVRVVIHVTMCFQLMQFVQESGRAGRSGLNSESIVLRAYWQNQDGTVGRALGYKMEPPVKEFLATQACRRVILDGYMDGRQDRQRCEAGESACDLCEAQPRGTKRAAEKEAPEDIGTEREAQRRKLEQAMAKEERRVELWERRKTEDVRYQLERLETYLDRWRHACAICMATKGETARHEWKACPHVSAAQAAQMKAQFTWLHRVKFEPFARCNYCWAPQALCNKWEETSEQGVFRSRGMKANCQYEGVLQGAAAALLAFQTLRVSRG
ncbi:hypothetical protein NX059_012132 [Plenodomus lindquistii]|nr:hypothetical protein NX059_012132 [Plenodomus lindquistii]